MSLLGTGANQNAGRFKHMPSRSNELPEELQDKPGKPQKQEGKASKRKRRRSPSSSSGAYCGSEAIDVPIGCSGSRYKRDCILSTPQSLSEEETTQP
ncbi:hypothetical protein ACKKBG_A38610 [Auxenochlorella protothecoides x Auxenochlorella symbiontica]